MKNSREKVSSGGSLIKVKVKTSAPRELLARGAKGLFLVSVKEKPKNGEANAAIKRLLARSFKLPLSKIILMRGAERPSKIFKIYWNGSD